MEDAMKAATVKASPGRTKRYVVPAYCDGATWQVPDVAVFEIGEEKAREIIRLAGLVREHKLLDCRKWDFSAAWHQSDYDVADYDVGDDEEAPPLGEEVRTEGGALVVSEDDFQFMGHIKHGPRIDCEGQYIAELAEHFGLPWDGGPAVPVAPEGLDTAAG